MLRMFFKLFKVTKVNEKNENEFKETILGNRFPAGNCHHYDDALSSALQFALFCPL